MRYRSTLRFVLCPADRYRSYTAPNVHYPYVGRKRLTPKRVPKKGCFEPSRDRKGAIFAPTTGPLPYGRGYEGDF